MKNIFLILIVLFQGSMLFSQVGIGTQTPHNSAMLEVAATDKGFLLPRLTPVQRNAISSPENGLQVYDVTTNSIWYFNGVFWVNTQAMASVGDIKSGIQLNDHSGWVLLDGRSINSLSANQQAVATALGLTGNIPNAGNTYLSQNGQPLASVNGANTSTITQANLPSVDFTGSAASAGTHNHGGASGNAGGHNHSGSTSTNGNHNHSGTTSTEGNHNHSYWDAFYTESTSVGWNGSTVNPGTTRGSSGSDTDNTSWQFSRATDLSGNHSHNLNINNSGEHSHTFTTSSVSDHSHSISNDGAHTHSVTVSSGGSGTPLNIAPRTLSVNMFIYLGL